MSNSDTVKRIMTWKNLVPLTPPALYIYWSCFIRVLQNIDLIMHGPVWVAWGLFSLRLSHLACMMHGLVAIIRSPTWKKRTYDTTDTQLRENSLFCRCCLWTLQHRKFCYSHHSIYKPYCDLRKFSSGYSLPINLSNNNILLIITLSVLII